MTEGECREENRREDRFDLTPPIKGELGVMPAKEVLTCEILNISDSGMCAVTNAQFPGGARIVCRSMAGLPVLKQVWSVTESIMPPRYKHGFLKISSGKSLIQELVDAGLIVPGDEGLKVAEEESFVDHFDKLDKFGRG